MGGVEAGLGGVGVGRGLGTVLESKTPEPPS